MMRKSGVLLPVASLPSRYGIGCFSKEAYQFVDQLEKCGQSFWQILPLGPTGYGDSPYQSCSTFAGNPYFIDLEELQKMGWLSQEECDDCDFGKQEQKIDYHKLYLHREPLLRKAYERSGIVGDALFQQFCSEEATWLEDYCLYMVIKNTFNGARWHDWDEDIRFREEVALRRYRREYEEEIIFYKFQQFLFSQQWKRLKNYANEKGIKIIGDIPIYVALDSADTWATPELFQFDEELLPIEVSGCPPDGFSSTGQLWGNPLYDWDYHEKTEYEWWCKRINHNARLYDMLRIDHFRGLDEYYSIPYGDITAEFGSWREGPRMSFFKALWKRLGEVDIIAEDLGFPTPGVSRLLSETCLPGMNVLQFAFDSRDAGNYLPYTYTVNSVVYTGTHDNNTTKAWYQELNTIDKKGALEYLGRTGLKADEAVDIMIRMALGSVAKLCVIPIQDYLHLGAQARINTPSTLGDNWTWRLKEGEITSAITKEIKELSRIYGRAGQK